MGKWRTVTAASLLIAILPAVAHAQTGTTRVAFTGGYDVFGSLVENSFSTDASIGYRWASGLALTGGTSLKVLPQFEAEPTGAGFSDGVLELQVDLLTVFGQLAYWFGETGGAEKHWRPFVGGRIGHVRYLENTVNKGGLEVGGLGGVEYEIGDGVSIRSAAVLTHLFVDRGITGVRARIQAGLGLSL